ncbi:MAG: hypothetical protein OEZ68_19800 [Gammaproteobacteria bacterium]|nr:hypothetical protein [Gammaproteobacteria bacterium]MDH5803054.1 hypothetical protein [Gammaproteobacteria bacterium]
MRSSLAHLAIALAALLPLSACKTLSTQWSAETGSVINQNHSPIPGAYVVALWKGIQNKSQTPAVNNEQHSCYHIETDLSSKTGMYTIKAWNKPETLNHIDHQSVEILAYKPGYVFEQQVLTAGKSNQTYLSMRKIEKPTRSHSRKERLKYLQKLVANTSCDLNTKGRKKLKAMYQAIVAEGKRIAKTHADKKRLKSLKRWTRFVAK